jgi:uncharacterized protein YdeI (YjbR/CyaY-like superfamily)
MKTPEHPLKVKSRAEWRAWLQENHAAQDEVWLAILKSQSPGPGVSYEEAVEEALCFGWIDGLTKSATAEFYVVRFSPRKRSSVWSVSNIQRVERLLAQGKMTEAGLTRIREAKENGEWEAAIRREDISTLPDDLHSALETNPAAQANFEKYPASQKKMFLHWILSAKTETTRQKRIQATVEMAEKNKKFGEK